MRRRSISAIALLLLGVAQVAACGTSDGGGEMPSGDSDSPTSPPRTTITSPGLQPPRQKNENRPDVVYDPCTYLDDSVISEIGGDPKTRRRSDFVAEYTFLDCKYDGRDWTLTISSSNITMAEERARYAGSIQEVDVNGRSSIIVHQPEDGRDSCALTMPTKEGDLRIKTFLTTDALVRNINPCDDLMRIAQIVEPTIGKGK